MMPDFFNSKDDELVLPSYPQDPDQIANRRKLVDKTEKLLQKNEVEYNIDSDNKRDFINAAPSIIGERNLPIELTLFDNISNLCSYLNKELVSIGGHVKRDNYNNLYLYYDKSLMKESVITEDIKSTVSNIRTKIKNKIDTISSSLRPMTRLEASKKYDVISDENVKEIKSIIKKVSDEAIKIFSKKDIVTKKKHSKVCKYSTNSTVKEEYLCGIKSKDAFHKIECIAVTISMTNRNVSDKEYEEIESIIWDEMYNDITAYIKSLKSKFAIHANPEIHDYNMHGRQKICLCITYFQELKPKSAVKEANIFINTDRVEYNVDTLKPDTDLRTLLDNTDPKHIYFTSDWHLLKNRYKNERNYVNCQEIVTWCRQNIKDDDIFMYLGDISYRWIDEKGEEESMKIMASLPGIKVLIAGNHDRMLGDDYLHGCGFKYIFDEYTWKNLVFTHRPINMSLYPDDYWNIHGHIHKWKKYNTTDGKKNINVYPYWFDNKPVTLDYLSIKKN